MKRPPLEVATILRAIRDSFVQKNRAWLQWSHLKVMGAIARCRTAELGGHRDKCPRCGHSAISYNSCRNRHCMKCQSAARQGWLERRQTELLPTTYSHVVFTLPHALSALMLQNKRLLYDLLFHASAEALLEVAANPRHLGAHIGFFGVLHTWGQNLLCSFSHSLCDSNGRPVAGSSTLDSFRPQFLPAQGCIERGVSREVRGWPGEIV